MVNPASVLSAVTVAVEAEGACLREEFHRPDGPRGRRGSAPVDTEIEERLRARLQQLVRCAFVGEETGFQEGDSAANEKNFLWLVDPHDGTSDFLSGRRGSSVSVALLRGGVPVLGVVHCPLPPDRAPDTIAWAEGAALQRNGRALSVELSRRALAPGELVWTNSTSALRPQTYSSAAQPARYAAMPSIAYRLARVAAGDGLAAISVHEVNEYDIAAGLALIRAAGGTMLDAAGREIHLAGTAEARRSGCFAGAPQAAARLAQFDWKRLEREPRRAARVSLGFPRTQNPIGLSRAQGCLLGLLIGDSVAAPPGSHTITGQPTAAGEMGLVLARFLVREKSFNKEKLFSAYRDWLTTRPVEVDETTERGLLGMHTAEAETGRSLARVAPIGIWAAGDPARAARAAHEDCALTHPNPLCLAACAAHCAAIAAGIAGADRKEMRSAALAHASGRMLPALERALHQLANSTFEEAMAAPEPAISGALLGAALGREAISAQRILQVLACRPLAEAGAPRPRPMELWPDDALELAEALLQT